jgi:hypothetical protein
MKCQELTTFFPYFTAQFMPPPQEGTLAPRSSRPVSVSAPPPALADLYPYLRLDTGGTNAQPRRGVIAKPRPQAWDSETPLNQALKGRAMLLALRAPGHRGQCYCALSGFSRAPLVFPGLRPGLCYCAPSGLKTGVVLVITLRVQHKMLDTISCAKRAETLSKSFDAPFGTLRRLRGPFSLLLQASPVGPQV